MTKHNKKILREEQANNVACNCVRAPCPMPGAEAGRNCKTSDIVYKASIQPDNEEDGERGYIGGTEQQLKDRVAFHRSCMRLEHLEKTSELSKEAHRIRRSGGNYTVKWSILEKSAKFEPGDSYCKLCIAEKYAILFQRDDRTLNDYKMERCLHKSKAMLGSVEVT